MKYKSIIFYILILAASVLSQPNGSSLDGLMNKKSINCWDIWYNAGEQIVRYYKESKMDSVKIIQKYWLDKCGLTEPLIRLQILESIKSNIPIDSFIDSNLVFDILYYKNRKIALKNDPKNFRNVNHRFNYPLELSYDSLTKSIAKSIDTSNLEFSGKLFTILYQDSFNLFFEKLYDKNNSSKIAKLFLEEIRKIKNKSDLSMGLITGIWLPTGNANLVGKHPIIGFYIGAKIKNLIIDADMNFKFLKSKNSYLVEQDGEIYTTDHFFGAYIGLDLTYVLKSSEKFNFNLLSGVAFDGWDALTLDKEKEIENQGVYGLNLNLGLGTQFFYKKFSNLGFEFRYNFNNFENENGTDFSGNTITAVLKWGFLGNVPKYKALEYFGYKTLKD